MDGVGNIRIEERKKGEREERRRKKKRDVEIYK